MGYKNQQFFDNGEGEISKRVNVKPLNPPFNYPSRTVRYNDYRNGKWEPRTHELQRGYIRTLRDYVRTGTTSEAKMPIAKCNFQFNPEFLNQQVQMRVGLMSFFQQSPAQMSQPVGGEVNFVFQLYFDRSYELNNEADEFDPDALGTATEKNIGVLADVRAFYQVIGQGVSKDFLEFQKSIARSRAEIEVELGYDSVESPDGTPPNIESALDAFFDNNVNFGNTAFLMPVPVRLVFSSLFMVDGYVTATEVSYAHFSKSLVPMSCTINVQMNAMYIGFAKDRTAVQVQLEKNEETDRRAVRGNQAAARAASKIIEDNIKKLEIRAYSKAIGIVSYSNDVRTVDNSTQDVKAIDGYLVSNDKFTDDFIKRTTPYGRGGDFKTAQQFFEVDIKESRWYSTLAEDDEKKQIEEIFKNNNVSIGMGITLDMYGPFSSAEANQFVSMIKTLTRDGKLSESNKVSYQRFLSKLISSTRLVDATINSFEEWENYVLGKKDKNRANKTMVNNQFSNESLKQLENTNNKYFVAAMSAAVSPSVSGYHTGVLQFYKDAKSIAVNGDNTSIKMSLDFKGKATDA